MSHIKMNIHEFVICKQLAVQVDVFIPEKWRMISILSYVIVLIAFGLPIWWFTTRVYRANLPLEEMFDLDETPINPLQLELHASNRIRMQSISKELQTVLGSTILIKFHKTLVKLPAEDSEMEIEKAALDTETTPGNILLIEWEDSPKEITITSQRVLYFNRDVDGYKLATFLEKFPGVDLKTALVNPNLNRVEVDNLRPFPAGPSFDVLITVANPGVTQVDWDFLGDVNRYVKPFLDKLEYISKFTIKSQWLYLVDLGVKPRQVNNHFALAEQLLPHIITPLEKKLSSHVSKNPVLNLVIYISSCATSPTHIYTKKGIRAPFDAFISPRWGGIQIVNPTNCTKFQPNSREIMSVLITQLTQLLGVGSFSLQFPTVRQMGHHPSQIQVDLLQRAHTLEYLTNSKLTLKSLAQLLSEISNIVINDEVAQSVQQAVESIKMAENLMHLGGRVDEVFAYSKMAAQCSESAFTDPSLLALLYFPDDQKYAVYIPLFLPIMIPVIMSMKQLWKYSKRNK